MIVNNLISYFNLSILTVKIKYIFQAYNKLSLLLLMKIYAKSLEKSLKLLKDKIKHLSYLSQRYQITVNELMKTISLSNFKTLVFFFNNIFSQLLNFFRCN